MALTYNTPRYGNIFVVADTFTDLRSVTSTQIAEGYSAIVKGGHAVADGLGGMLVWNSASTTADDDLTVIAPADGSTGRWLKIAVGVPGDDAAEVLYKAGIIAAPTVEAFNTYLLSQGSAAASAATAQAQAAQVSAGNAAGSATASASSATSSQTSANASAASAASATASAGQAQMATAAARAYPASAATVVPAGVTNATIVAAGTGGTNGTFALSITGGGGSNASGTFTVAGGAVSAISITGAGYGYTSSPTLGFSASSGLTGASATAAIGALVASGTYYWAQSSDGQSLNLYQNANGTATLASPAVSIPTNAALASAVSTASGATMAVPDIVDARFPAAKNLFDPARVSAGYIASNGVLVSNTVHVTSDFIPVAPGMTFICNQPIVANTTASGRICFFDSNKAFVSNVGNTGSDFPAAMALTVPATTTIRYMRVSIVLATAKAPQVMLVRGTTLPATFISFDTPDRLTIASHIVSRNQDLSGQFVNLHDPTATVDGLLLNNGTLSTTSDYFTTKYMPVVQGGSVIFRQSDDFNPGYGMAWYDKDYNILSVTACPIQGNTPYTVPPGASYLRRSYRKKISAGSATAIRNSLGEVEVYNATTLPVKLQSAEKINRASALDAIASSIYSVRPTYTNLLDLTRVTVGQLYQSGGATATTEASPVTFATGFFSHVIACSPDVPVVMSDVTKFSNSYPIILWYDANGNFMSGTYGQFVGGLYQPKLNDGTPDPSTPPAALYPPRGARFMRTQGVGDPTSGTFYVGFGTLPPAGTVTDALSAVKSLKRWNGKRWIAAGDSITAIDHSGQFWMPQTASYLGATLTNNAVSGHRMSHVLADPQFTQVNIAANDLATVAMGTNDWGVNVPLGTANDALSAQTFAGFTKTLIETVLGWNPSITLVFRTPLQRSYATDTSNANANSLLDYVNMIQKIAGEQYGLPVYDAYRNSGFNAPRNTITDQTVGWTQDGLHPNAVGGSHLWQPWGKFLESL